MLVVRRARRARRPLFTQQAQVELAGVASADDMQALKALERTAGHMHGVDSVDLAGRDADDQRGRAGRAAARGVPGLGIGVRRRRDREEAIAQAEFALADGVLQRDDVGLFWAIAGIVQEVADVDHGSLWDDALADAHARGSLFAALAVHLWRGYAQWRRGELREAYTSLTASTEFSYQYGGLIGAPYGHAFLIHLLIDRGEVAEARAYYDSVRHEVRIGDGARLRRQAECALLLAEGRYAEAIELSLLARVDDAVPEESGLAADAQASGPGRSVRSGRTDEALGAHGRGLSAGAASGARRARSAGRCSCAGEVSGADGESAAARSPRDPHRRAGAGAGRRHPGSARPEPGHRRCGRAGRTAAAGGAPGRHHRRARAARRRGRPAAGVGAPRCPQPPASLSLTSTERRIARLTADGAEVREIAEALFLTPRAVQLSLDEIRGRLQRDKR